LRWLDVGCGTGALSDVIIQSMQPAALTCVDPSSALLNEARARLGNAPVQIVPGDAMCLPFPDRTFDVAVSGLVLNFVPDAQKMIKEMKRVVRTGGNIGSYVWDFSGGASVTQHIGQALGELDPSFIVHASAAQKAHLTSQEAMLALLAEEELEAIDSVSILVNVNFDTFEDYWRANTTFASPHARQLAGLSTADYTEVQARVRALLGPSNGAAIAYKARANCVRGVVSNQMAM
jgi:ubiquinone/menaquinone biosynthesis C-methylase UbiE